MLKNVLSILKTPESDKRPIAIARELGITKDQVNMLFDELVRLGYLERPEKAKLELENECSSFACRSCAFASSCSSDTQVRSSSLQLTKKASI